MPQRRMPGAIEKFINRSNTLNQEEDNIRKNQRNEQEIDFSTKSTGKITF